MTMQQTIKPILKYPGSKWQQAEWIINCLPVHTRYLEPFFGSGAVFFLKPSASAEIINDIADDVVTLLRVVRDRGDELAALIELTPWARTEYEHSYAPATNDLEQARRFVVRCWQSFGSTTGGRVGWKNTGGDTNDRRLPTWKQLPDRIRLIVPRLLNCEIDNRPAVEVITRYRATDTLIYADPPYPQGERRPRLYKHEMTDADHALLLDTLDAHPGPVVLSGYHCALYDDRLRHWHTREKQAQAEKGNTRTEVLWLNQVCIDRLGYGPMFDHA